MKECNCSCPGWCSFYKLNLVGRQYLVAHELEGTPEEQQHYRKLLINLGNRKPAQIKMASDDVKPVTKQFKKGCGCRKRITNRPRGPLHPR